MNKNIRILLIIFVIAVIAIISYKNYEEARIEAHYAKYLPNTFLELNSMMFHDSLLTHDEYHKFLTNLFCQKLASACQKSLLTR